MSRSPVQLIIRGAAFALLVLLVACQSQYVSGGKLHFDQGRFPQALENFEKAVAEQPENAEAHLWLGRALAELERDEEAVDALHRALELDPLQEEMVTNSLISYWSRRYNSALAYAKNGDEAQASGDAAAAQEQRTLAEERFQRAMIFAPDSVQNYSNLGRVVYQLGRQDEAMELFRRAKEMSTGKPELQMFLFSLFKVLGEQAIQGGDQASYERALTLLHDAETLTADEERMLEVHFNLGSAYFGMADFEPARREEHLARAAAYYNKVLDVAPDDDMALESLAYVYSDQGEHEAALAMGQRRLDLTPWDSAPHLLMHRLFRAAGNERSANGHLLLIQMMNEGVRQSVGNIREHAGEFGPGSDMLQTLRDRGAPEEIRTFAVGFTPYEAWFYWTEGRVYMFQEGTEKFRIGFKALSREKLAEILG
jgi:tetratricopeptide (TPR) repeat protein